MIQDTTFDRVAAPSPVATLVDVVYRRARSQPDRRAFTFLKDGETECGHLSYRDLDLRARAIAAEIQSRSNRGDRAILLYPSGPEFVEAFFACLYAGVVPVPVYPPHRRKDIERLMAIAEHTEATLVLTAEGSERSLKRRSAGRGESSALISLATGTVRSNAAGDWILPPLTSDMPALLHYTSGSTAEPKGVQVSHANLMHNLQATCESFGHTEQTVFVNWLPLYHGMGLTGGVLHPVYTGRPCILMSPADFLEKPIRWLQAISRYGATVSGGPNSAYELCVRSSDVRQRSALDLRTWDTAISLGEPVREQTLRTFSEAFSPYGFRFGAFHPCYGLAEGTLLCAGTAKNGQPRVIRVDPDALARHRVDEATGSSSRRSIVSCGRSICEQEIRIVDPESGTECPADCVGEIWVSGPSVARGYWHLPIATEESFLGYLDDTGEGPFLRTGDLGFLRGGELFVTGRHRDRIIDHGRTHYPQDIEATVESCHPALRSGSGAALSVEVDESHCVIVVQEVGRKHVPDLDPDDVIEAIRGSVARKHGIHVNAVVLLGPDSIPKTPYGKLQRGTCRDQFLNGELQSLAAWYSTYSDTAESFFTLRESLPESAGIAV